MDKIIETEILKFYTDWAYLNPNAPVLTKKQILEQIEDLKPLEFAKDVAPITEIEELKINLEFAEWEKTLLEAEIIDLKLSQIGRPVIDMNVYQSLFDELQAIKTGLNPVSKFFDDGHQALPQKKRLSKKDKERFEDEVQIQKMELASLQRLKKKGII